MNMINSKMDYRNVLRERLLLEELDCPYLIKHVSSFLITCRLVYAFQSSTRLYLITDYYEGGDLRSHLHRNRFSEEQVQYIVAGLSVALEYLHCHHIVYRDLKPENVMMDKEGRIHLIDLGLCKELETDENDWSIGGTPSYIAPEVIERKEYSYGVDWWSLGILMWELLTGKPPFAGNNHRDLYNEILHNSLEKPVYMSISISYSNKNVFL